MRHTALLFVLLPLTFACGPKSGRLGADGGADYFPVPAGASWDYVAHFNGMEFHETRLLVPADVGGVDAFVFVDAAEKNEPVISTFTGMFGLGAYHLGPEGLETWDAFWMSDVDALKPDDRQLMLALPPQLGSSITLNTDSPDRSRPITVEAFEAVTVPAGTFEDCVRIHLGDDSYAWLAPGVGLVKWVLLTGRVEELEAFSFPK